MVEMSPGGASTTRKGKIKLLRKCSTTCGAEIGARSRHHHHRWHFYMPAHFRIHLHYARLRSRPTCCYFACSKHLFCINLPLENVFARKIDSNISWKAEVSLSMGISPAKLRLASCLTLFTIHTVVLNTSIHSRAGV